MGMEQYRSESHPVCGEGAAIAGDRYRITVLTPALLRLEYNEKGILGT